MEKRLPFFSMPGINVSYFGLIKCRDIAAILTVSDHPTPTYEKQKEYEKIDSYRLKKYAYFFK
jgi:hypothetical protein